MAISISSLVNLLVRILAWLLLPLSFIRSRRNEFNYFEYPVNILKLKNQEPQIHFRSSDNNSTPLEKFSMFNANKRNN